MKYKDLPRVKNQKFILQFQSMSKDMQAIWLESMGFALVIAELSAYEDQDEDCDVLQRKYLEMTGFMLGLPKAEVLAVIEYIQTSESQCQN